MEHSLTEAAQGVAPNRASNRLLIRRARTAGEDYKKAFAVEPGIPAPMEQMDLPKDRVHVLILGARDCQHRGLCSVLRQAQSHTQVLDTHLRNGSPNT